MEDLMEKGIREIMERFPQVERVLLKYGIECGSCNVGVCRLKDIVEIHGLDEKREREIYSKIRKAVKSETKDAPAQEIDARESASRQEKLPYSEPSRILVDEHERIKRWLHFIPAVLEGMESNRELGLEIVRQGVDFMRLYADRFHHAKEEEILFREFKGEHPVIKSMEEDHTSARAHTRAILEAIERRDMEAVREHLNEYQDLLMEHIKKEDEVMLPWMDQTLSSEQKGKVLDGFKKVQEELSGLEEKQLSFIRMLEERYSL
jgi:hemerythrin-like domain-containing protein